MLSHVYYMTLFKKKLSSSLLEVRSGQTETCGQPTNTNLDLECLQNLRNFGTTMLLLLPLITSIVGVVA